jgi:hypothetical protein
MIARRLAAKWRDPTTTWAVVSPRAVAGLWNGGRSFERPSGTIRVVSREAIQWRGRDGAEHRGGIDGRPAGAGPVTRQQIAEGYKAVDERRTTKVLLTL